jgi:major membrane immunogen (membrane-anchored lipoprotein)
LSPLWRYATVGSHRLPKGSNAMLRRLSALSVAFAFCLATPSFGATLPTDAEQEILVKTTLMTFNDANLTGNYSVLHDKSSKAFRSQISAEKMFAGFKDFREKKINIESVVADDIASMDDPKIDKDGVLALKGRFKDDAKKVRFDLKFVQDDGTWKLLGINVSYKQD